jgi:hypothetical protein
MSGVSIKQRVRSDLLAKLTNAMEQSPSWEANSHAASQ